MATFLTSNPLDLWSMFAVLEPKPAEESLDEYLHRSEGCLLSNNQLTVIFAEAASKMHQTEMNEWKEVYFVHQHRINGDRYDEHSKA